MGTGTVDECVRQLILVGSNPDKIGLLDNFCMGNPEDPAELGRLVECVKAIARAADAYNAPFISGKDSFYNYFETEDGPINVPVTFLCSGFGVVESPDHVIGSSLRRNDSLLYLIGHTEDEMGGSVFARTHGVEDGKVPQTDCAANMELYKAYYNALTSGLVLSAHDVSEGGLAVTAAEMPSPARAAYGWTSRRRRPSTDGNPRQSPCSVKARAASWWKWTRNSPRTLKRPWPASPAPASVASRRKSASPPPAAAGKRCWTAT